MKVRPTGQVVQLRPRVIARRSAALRGRILAQRATSTPSVQQMLDIVAEVLDRADQVPTTELCSWEKLLTLLEELDHTTQSTPACAAVANLVALARFNEPADQRALASLADLLGHEELARLQHRYSAPLEPDEGLPIASEAVRRLMLSGHVRAAHALLSQGIDPTWTVPALESVEELVDIAERGTIIEWRHHMAMIVEDPWSPTTCRIVELAQETGHTCGAMSLAAMVGLCRQQTPRSAQQGSPRPVDRHPSMPDVRRSLP